MKKMKAFLLTLILFLAISNTGFSSTIDEISVQPETDNTTSVVISGTFSDGCERNLVPLTTPLEQGVMVQIFTEKISDNCSAEPVPFVSTTEIIPPDKEEYLLTAFLYDGIPGQEEDVQLLDSESITIEQEPGDGDNETDNETGEVFEVSVNITPETLNLKSNGRWITAHVTVAGDKSIEDIDVDSISMEDSIAVDKSSISSSDLMLKFSRSEVVSLIEDMDIDPPETIELSITGNFTDDNETSFEAMDTVRVINPGNNKNKGGKKHGKGMKH